MTRYISATYEIQVQASARRFSIPIAVGEMLDLTGLAGKNYSGPFVDLLVSDTSGRILYQGPAKLTSGLEVGSVRTIEPGQHIRVSVWRAGEGPTQVSTIEPGELIRVAVWRAGEGEPR